jgi:hypothetical protein
MFYFVPRNKSLGNKVFEHFVKIFSREFWPDNFNEQNLHKLNVGIICASEIYSQVYTNFEKLVYKLHFMRKKRCSQIGPEVFTVHKAF